MPWLVISIALSIVLTLILNVGMRTFPGASRRVARKMIEPTMPSAAMAHGRSRRARVWMPWKAMIVGSVILTIIVNLVL